MSHFTSCSISCLYPSLTKQWLTAKPWIPSNAQHHACWPTGTFADNLAQRLSRASSYWPACMSCCNLSAPLHAQSASHSIIRFGGPMHQQVWQSNASSGLAGQCIIRISRSMHESQAVWLTAGCARGRAHLSRWLDRYAITNKSPAVNDALC